MSSAIQLIVGLANPGKEYEDTRHNAGAWLIEKITHMTKIQLRFEQKYHAFHSSCQLGQHNVHLIVPTTFMNLSGQAVRAYVHYHKISASQILVAHDDIDLPVGVVKLKFDGGDGGHNGLKDVMKHLHTKQFYRLRIGVGHPGKSKDVVDYVLNKPSKADRERIDQALNQVEDILPLMLSGQMQQAMQKLHTET